MGRWRPPQPSGSRYITPEGHARMTDEVKKLWPERDKVTKEVQAAAALGDRSENAEYIYGKKKLREIDRRLRHLGNRLEKVNVVHDQPKLTKTIFFGAWVKLEDEEGIQNIYRIVGPDEFDMHKNYISMDSPVAKALLKKSIDDEITVKIPSGEKTYYIVDVVYGDPEW